MTQKLRKVLVTAAGPADQSRLRLDQEFRLIDLSHERSRNRDSFKVYTKPAVTDTDLRRYLLDFEPEIVHFSGHGGGPAGLCFDDGTGGTHLIRSDALARLFQSFAGHVKCVVLNACLSEDQANAIRQHIDYTIGMQHGIADESALRFAEGFYDGVWAGKNYEEAFALGCNAIDLRNLPGHLTPVIKKGLSLGGAELHYSDRVGEMETLVSAYLKTPYTDRYPYCLGGEALKEVMERHYKDSATVRFESARLIGERQMADGYTLAVFETFVGTKRQTRELYLKRCEGVYKIDWYASVGHAELPLKVFESVVPGGEHLFRVEAEIGNLFPHALSGDSGQYYSLRLADINGVSLWAYVPRHKALGPRIYEILKDGREHRLLLGLHYMHLKGGPVAFVTKLVSDNWLAPAEKV